MSEEINQEAIQPEATAPQEGGEVTLEQAQQAAKEALEKAAAELGTLEEEPQEEDESTKPLSPNEIPEELVTGDDYIDAGLRLLAKSGNVTPADISKALGSFFQSGDPDDLDVAYIGEKFGENADFAIKLAKEYASRIKTETSRLVEEVHSLAGGEGAWNVAMTAFNTDAPDYLRAAAKALADKGDPKGAASIVLDYVGRTGKAVNKGKMIKGGSANLNAPLGKEEFAKAYEELKARYPNQSFSSGQAGKEYQRLIERRQLAKAINR